MNVMGTEYEDTATCTTCKIVIDTNQSIPRMRIISGKAPRLIIICPHCGLPLPARLKRPA